MVINSWKPWLLHFYYMLMKQFSRDLYLFMLSFFFRFCFYTWTDLMVWCFAVLNKKKKKRMKESLLQIMIHKPAPKFRSESNDSQTRSEVPIWIKWFTNPLRSSDLNQMIHKPAPKFRSESNDSQTRSEVPIWIKWFANPLWRGAFPKSNYGPKFRRYNRV